MGPPKPEHRRSGSTSTPRLSLSGLPGSIVLRGWGGIQRAKDAVAKCSPEVQARIHRSSCPLQPKSGNPGGIPPFREGCDFLILKS